MAKSTKNLSETLSIHQWTHNADEVLILRFSDPDGRSYGGFQHPMQIGETVTEPHWDPTPFCGGGIHGWPWGIGLGDGKEPDWKGLWQVYAVKPGDVVGNVGDGPKCKFRTGVLRYAGDWQRAMDFILPGQMAWVFETSKGEASNSGDYGAASNSGDYGAASNSGDYGAASNSGYGGAASNSGDYGAASNSGSRGAASNSGSRGAASNSGYGGAASNSGYGGAAICTGSDSKAESTTAGTAAVVTGKNGKAQAGEYGCIALAWWNEKHQRFEMRCAEIGSGDGSDGKLKANVWYRLNAKGKFILSK